MMARRIGIVMAAACALVAGCAYFNTLYNAKETFRQAEKAQEAQARNLAAGGESLPAGRNPQAPQYEAVIDKCKNIMATYPDSRHVDDAMLLTAKSLYRLGRYDEAVAALDSMEARFPKTELLDDLRFFKGKSLVAAKKYDVAAPVLRDYVNEFDGHHDHAEGLYLLCISLMQLDMSNEAVATLGRLEKEHGRSDYRFRAQVEMADILADKELYQESLEVYERLSDSRIPESFRVDVLLGMARVQQQVGDHSGALATLDRLKKLPPGSTKEPELILVRARSYAGIDSLARAITSYKDVTERFARGTYAAEAHFRLGELYEAMDSLQVAQANYQEVPRAYSGSTYAEEAIKRSTNITRVLRLQQTAGDDSPEAIAMRTFSMAEIQLFQFTNTEKAIPNYEKVANEYPESEFAPRAVYALGYIHGVVLGDTAKAREWYDVLRTKYPDSPQAQFAYAFYKGATPPPPYSELMRNATVVKAAAPTPAAEPARRGRPTRPVPKPAAPDTTGGQASPPPAPPPAPASTDTSSAPADTTGGGN